MAQFEPRVNLPGSNGDLDDERKTSIQNALQKYRETVLKLNEDALEVVMQGIEEEESPDDEWSEDELREARLKSLHDSYGIYLGPSDDDIQSIRDFQSPERRETLIATCSLDGVNHGPVQTALRQACFARHEDSISRTAGIQPLPPRLPNDLKYLATLVRGVCGPGLPEYRAHNQATFLTDMDRMRDYSDNDHRIVVRPTQEQLDRNEFTALANTWDDWEIAVGVRLGDAENAWNGGYAIYCRHPSDSNHGEWAWRYGMKYQMFQSEVVDSVEEFLGWYATFRKQSEEDDNIEIFPLED